MQAMACKHYNFMHDGVPHTTWGFRKADFSRWQLGKLLKVARMLLRSCQSCSPKLLKSCWLLKSCFFLITWGSGILLAGHTRFNWANPTAGSLRRCLTSKTRHTPNTNAAVATD
jgi:hypothetical protein